MGIEENKALIRRYFALREMGGLAACRDLFADDLVWVMPHRGEQAATFTKEEMIARSESFWRAIDSKFEMKILGVTAEGNRVAVECEGHVKMKNGKIYSNLYHFLFVIEDGKIKVGKEYLDSLYSYRIFSGAPPVK